MEKKLRIAFSNDNGGVDLKKQLMNYVLSLGHEVVNLGPDDETSVDYPDMVKSVCEQVKEQIVDYGVLICGSGIGISIAANRQSGIRAALCNDHLMAKLSRQHNDANIIAFGGRLIGVDTAKDCLDVFFKTSFDGGRHLRRVEKLG